MIGVFLLLLVFTVIGKPEPARAAASERIELNQSYMVQFTRDDNSRLYEFTVPQTGNLSIQAKNVDPAGSQWVGLQLFNSNNVALTNRWDGSNVELPIFSTDANKTFYLKVTGFAMSYETAFVLTVNFEPTTDWESEDNDAAASADVITAGKNWYGAINDYNDSCDYFKFTLNATKKVAITFGPKEVSGNSPSWNVDLINSSNQSKEIYSSGSTTQTYTCYLKKGTYYLQVKKWIDSKNVPYALSYKESALKLVQPVISSMKLDVYTDWIPYVETPCVGISNVKIKNSGDATGYMLRIAKKKSMKGKLAEGHIDFDSKNTKKVVQVPAYLPIVKTYYVQAKSYVTDPFGIKIYGKYGAVKSKSLSNSLYKKLKK